MNTKRQLKNLHPLLMDKYAECQNTFSKEVSMGHLELEKISKVMRTFLALIKEIDEL